MNKLIAIQDYNRNYKNPGLLWQKIVESDIDDQAGELPQLWRLFTYDVNLLSPHDIQKIGESYKNIYRPYFFSYFYFFELIKLF